VSFKVASSEGDLLWGTRLRDQLAFLMNSLDLAYEAPTPADYAAYDELHGLAAADLERLNALLNPR